RPARLYDFDSIAHADAGHAAYLLLLPAVADAVRLHVPVSGYARLGAGVGGDFSPHAFPAYRPRGHAEGRPPFRHCRRGERPLVLRGAVCVAGAVTVPADAGLAGRWSQRCFRT